MKKILEYVKKDVVLAAAWLLALISAFFVHPSFSYIKYIDFRSLGILWSLMIIMQVYRESNVFEMIGQKLLGKIKKLWQLVFTLVFLCFFASMFITNDVSLITFVPFSILILKKCGKENMMIPVIVLQTIAANLGSMMTPIGNPQNLYLYGISEMSLISFIKLVGPYTLISGILLAVSALLLKGKSDSVDNNGGGTAKVENKKAVIVYSFLFVFALLVVLRIVPYIFLVGVVLVISLIMHRSSLKHVDYSLLLTFVGFFIFTGNIGAIPSISSMLEKIVTGHEMIVGVVLSQAISNVPAALLISDFAKNLNELILGVNFGGLGTLIASMASLISYKLYAKEKPENRIKYLAYFTVLNVVFLTIILISYFVM